MKWREGGREEMRETRCGKLVFTKGISYFLSLFNFLCLSLSHTVSFLPILPSIPFPHLAHAHLALAVMHIPCLGKETTFTDAVVNFHASIPRRCGRGRIGGCKGEAEGGAWDDEEEEKEGGHEGGRPSRPAAAAAAGSAAPRKGRGGG